MPSGPNIWAKTLSLDFATWPEAVEYGALPPEAGCVLLELCREFNEAGCGQPTVRSVQWCWRVRQARPNAPWHAVLTLGAAFLALEDEGGADQRRLAAGGLPRQPEGAALALRGRRGTIAEAGPGRLSPGGAIPLDRGFRLMSACCQTYPWGCSLPCRSERPLSGET